MGGESQTVSVASLNVSDVVDSATTEQPTGNVTLTMDLAGDVAGPVFFIDDAMVTWEATGVYDGSYYHFYPNSVDSANINH